MLQIAGLRRSPKERAGPLQTLGMGNFIYNPFVFVRFFLADMSFLCFKSLLFFGLYSNTSEVSHFSATWVSFFPKESCKQICVMAPVPLLLVKPVRTGSMLHSLNTAILSILYSLAVEFSQGISRKNSHWKLSLCHEHVKWGKPCY